MCLIVRKMRYIFILEKAHFDSSLLLVKKYVILVCLLSVMLLHLAKLALVFFRIIPEGLMPEMPAPLQELQRKMPGRSQQGLSISLLSQDVAVNLLQENKTSIRRCELV